MSTVGIIANPASGKDIRRLVSHATVIDNNEKVNIIERIILGAQKFGVNKIIIMPDSYVMGHKVIDKLRTSNELMANIEILDMKIKASPKDTEQAAKLMEKLQPGCVVVLGGDGTNRLVAKHLKTVPLIGVSTGTNNAYPEMIEGTVVGMAASVVASGQLDLNLICKKDKIIEIYKNGQFADIALIDVVISNQIHIGTKAIWKLNNIKQIIVSKCHPASIGFSALLGVNVCITKDDDYGASLKINTGTNQFLAPIAAGIVIPVISEEVKILPLNQSMQWIANYRGVIAVDGEREFGFVEGETLEFKITRNGPYHVDVRKSLEVALENNYFNKI